MRGGLFFPSLFAVAAFAACGSFGEKDETSVADGGPADAAIPTDAGDGAVPTCGASRTAVLRCGGSTCTNGTSCCVNGAVERYCQAGNCPGTQMNCQGSADCPGTPCCQTGGFIGSQCMKVCEADKARYCYSNDECGPGEGCLPFPTAGFDDVWACAPCP